MRGGKNDAGVGLEYDRGFILKEVDKRRRPDHPLKEKRMVAHGESLSNCHGHIPSHLARPPNPSKIGQDDSNSIQTHQPIPPVIQHSRGYPVHVSPILSLLRVSIPPPSDSFPLALPLRSNTAPSVSTTLYCIFPQRSDVLVRTHPTILCKTEQRQNGPRRHHSPPNPSTAILFILAFTRTGLVLCGKFTRCS